MKPINPVRWAVGVTTVPSRRCDLLPQTLHSLRSSGFSIDRLFVDGERDCESWRREHGCEVTARWPAIRTAGNWSLSLAELWFRHQEADRYAVFQDDFVCVRNLRPYLDRCEYPARGYWNLLTAHQNEPLAVGKRGWFKSDQNGRGAVALVFDKYAVMTLLSPYPGKPHSHLAERVMNAHRGWRAIDGGVSEQMKGSGWTEWIHAPSLVQHISERSSMGNKNYKPAQTFPGVEFDAATLG